MLHLCKYAEQAAFVANTYRSDYLKLGMLSMVMETEYRESSQSREEREGWEWVEGGWYSGQRIY